MKIYYSVAIIESGQTLKVLGFTLDKCSINAHIDSLKIKFAKPVWILSHLKRARIEERKLIRVYCSFIRPIFDYLRH